jgi:hypothetical protein
MVRTQAMAGDPAVMGDRTMRREMERLEARWRRIADELESALRSMEQVRNRLASD